MTKDEIQIAAASRFQLMGIQLSTSLREPISALVNQQTSKWLGFLKVDLRNPQKDGIAMLKGERIFTLQLQNNEFVVGKIEKGFEFNSAAIENSDLRALFCPDITHGNF